MYKMEFKCYLGLESEAWYSGEKLGDLRPWSSSNTSHRFISTSFGNVSYVTGSCYKQGNGFIITGSCYKQGNGHKPVTIKGVFWSLSVLHL